MINLADRKPMLASDAPAWEDIRFPLYASPKLDGVRCQVIGGVAYARSMKPIENRFVQEWASRNEHSLEGLDGELIVGPANSPDAFKNTSGAVRRREGQPDFTFHVFDDAQPCMLGYPPFAIRQGFLTQLKRRMVERVRVVHQSLIGNCEVLKLYHGHNLDDGYEGTMCRHPHSTYKHGRATTASQDLFKLKPKARDEGVIIGMEELMHNENEATTNELGRTKRSKLKENLVPAGVMGKLEVRIMTGKFAGETVKVGTGFTAAERKDFWDHKDAYMDEVITFEHCTSGADAKPRHPSFKGLRDKADMGE